LIVLLSAFSCSWTICLSTQDASVIGARGPWQGSWTSIFRPDNRKFPASQTDKSFLSLSSSNSLHRFANFFSSSKPIVSLNERSPCIFSIRGNHRAKYLLLDSLSNPAPTNSAENRCLNSSTGWSCRPYRIPHRIQVWTWQTVLVRNSHDGWGHCWNCLR
jgi:hypothetical protein